MSKSQESEKKDKLIKKNQLSFWGRFFSSFKFKIVFYLMVFAIIPVMLLAVMEKYYYNDMISKIEMNGLQTQAAVMADELRWYEDLKTANGSGQYNTFNNFASINEVRIRVIDPNFKVAFDTNLFDYDKTLINETVNETIKTSKATSRYVTSSLLESAVPIKSYSGKQIGVFLLSKNISDLNTSISAVSEYSNLIILIVVFSLAFIAIFLVIRFNNRSKYVTGSIAEIAAGNIDKRLDGSISTEFNDMLIYFNEIMDNAKEVDRSREEFVSNVSHELKTPMTSMKLLADSLLADPNTPIELYREFMQDIASEIDRENDIIEDLLTLVRMDKNVIDLSISTVNINDIVSKIMKRITPIANRKSIELVFESVRDVEAEVDEIKLTQVITNLVENAVKYNKEGGYVHVSLNADYSNFYLKIEDNGIGIPEEYQKNIFERFYRIDKARSRETGGTGLGLSIVRSIVLMHNGQIKVYSEAENDQGEGGMTVFTVRIPLKNKKNNRNLEYSD